MDEQFCGLSEAALLALSGKSERPLDTEEGKLISRAVVKFAMKRLEANIANVAKIADVSHGHISHIINISGSLSARSLDLLAKELKMSRLQMSVEACYSNLAAAMKALPPAVLQILIARCPGFFSGHVSDE